MLKFFHVSKSGSQPLKSYPQNELLYFDERVFQSTLYFASILGQMDHELKTQLKFNPHLTMDVIKAGLLRIMLAFQLQQLTRYNVTKEN